MFYIKYIVHDIGTIDPLTADDSELRYSFFLGNIFLRSGNDAIEIDWEWIPILDFAIGMLFVLDCIKENNHATEKFEFTESESFLEVCRNGDDVSISISFSNNIIKVDFTEFEHAVTSFYKEVIEDVLSNKRELTNNPAFLKYLTCFGGVSN